MELIVTGEVFEWRGPAPHYFVALDADQAAEVEEVKSRLTYGWGVIPATVTLGDTTFTTSLFPKDGTFLVPLKLTVRKAEGVGEDDVVTLRVQLSPS